MRLVTAVVLPERLGPLRAALRAFGVPQYTVTPILQAAPPNRPELYRGVRAERSLFPRTKVEIAAADQDAHDIVHILLVTAGGPATIWLTRLERFADIRPHEPPTTLTEAPPGLDG